MFLDKLYQDMATSARADFKTKPVTVSVHVDLDNVNEKKSVRLKDYVKIIYDKQYEKKFNKMIEEKCQARAAADKEAKKGQPITQPADAATAQEDSQKKPPDQSKKKLTMLGYSTEQVQLLTNDLSVKFYRKLGFLSRKRLDHNKLINLSKDIFDQYSVEREELKKKLEDKLEKGLDIIYRDAEQVAFQREEQRHVEMLEEQLEQAIRSGEQVDENTSKDDIRVIEERKRALAAELLHHRKRQEVKLQAYKVKSLQGFDSKRYTNLSYLGTIDHQIIENPIQKNEERQQSLEDLKQCVETFDMIKTKKVPLLSRNQNQAHRSEGSQLKQRSTVSTKTKFSTFIRRNREPNPHGTCTVKGSKKMKDVDAATRLVDEIDEFMKNKCQSSSRITLFRNQQPSLRENSLAPLVENSMSVIENESPSEESKSEREHIKIVPNDRSDVKVGIKFPLAKATTLPLQLLTRQPSARLGKLLPTRASAPNPKKPLTKRQQAQLQEEQFHKEMMEKRKAILKHAQPLEGNFVAKLNKPYFLSNEIMNEMDLTRKGAGKTRTQKILQQLKSNLLIDVAPRH